MQETRATCVSLLLQILLVSSLILVSPKQSYSQQIEIERAELLTKEVAAVAELLAKGRYDEAISKGWETLSIIEKNLGPEHPSIYLVLYPVAMSYARLNDFAKAEPLLRRSLEVAEKNYGPEDERVAGTLSSLGLIYQLTGDYRNAETCLRRALSINEKLYGSEDSRVADNLRDLARTYEQMGEYERAGSLLTQSLDIMKNLLDAEDPHLAEMLQDLGEYYDRISDIENAEQAYRQAIYIKEKAFGPQHPGLTPCLHKLALLYLGLGFREKAEFFSKRALDIDEKAYGHNDFHTARSLSHMGQLYLLMEDYSRAEHFCVRALRIKEKVSGAEHASVAVELMNLAEIYKNLSEYEKAESFYARAIVILENSFGKEHPLVAEKLRHLAYFYADTKQYDKAVMILQKALVMNEKALGKEHPEVGWIAMNLAILQNHLGDVSSATLLYHRALKIYEDSFGTDHPFVASILTELGWTNARQGDFNKSYDLFKRAQDIQTNLLDQIMGFTNENQKMGFLIEKQNQLFVFLSLVCQHFQHSQLAKKDGFNLWLKRKGLILEFQKTLQEAVIASEDPSAIATLAELFNVRSQLSTVAFSRSNNGNSDTQKGRIIELKKRLSELEVELSRKSKAFDVKQRIAKADCDQLAPALQDNAVLVDFARIDMVNFGSKKAKPEWKPAHYFAFILPVGRPEALKLIDLGDAKKIENALDQLKKHIAVMDEKSSQSSKKVYEMIFQPIEKELGKAKKIFISPDGDLNLIPFEVLQDSDGKYLIQKYTFNYVTASRELVGFGKIISKGENPVLIGDPDFDMGAEDKKPFLPELALKNAKERAVNQRSADMLDLRFKRLPYTGEEVLDIQSLLGKDNAKVYCGREALEEVLQQTRTPRILHLATHGFFLKDQRAAAINTLQLSADVFSPSGALQGTNRELNAENALLRSGIALAGANTPSSLPGVQDGILTAEEILGLNLWGTDMVVLSACGTGLGDVRAGEGVFGLRRAFTQAGAKSLVMSMWSVPDQETKELMIQFYKNIETGGMDRCQALRQAILKEMELVEKRYGTAYPLCWGGFVFVGDPGGPPAN